ncbi:hypothetical protein [Paractinoplanes deccanensis]|uniref:hypothetical protein n=1 Tax=Paractinoplanes deccanensis TaxID=113561 RepID=UPI00194444CF|nr:hypothetical protein [Actinoplanes deccanensis]
MTSPQRRNDRRNHEPSWCTKRSHDEYPGLHKSAATTVGSRRAFVGEGEVTVYLKQGMDGPVWVSVCAAHMSSATASVPLRDAAVLRDALTALLKAAGHES